MNAATPPSVIDAAKGRHPLRSLAPYLWPPGQLEMRARVVLAMLLLVAAKVATVYVPIFYKDAVDALSAKGGLR